MKTVNVTIGADDDDSAAAEFAHSPTLQARVRGVVKTMRSLRGLRMDIQGVVIDGGVKYLIRVA
jgi:hypothetical protein